MTPILRPRRHAATVLSTALTAALLAAVACAQTPAAQPAADALIERFTALDFRKKAAIVRTLQRQLATLQDPALRRIARWRTDTDGLPDAAAAPPVFDPAEFAAAEHGAGRAPSRRPRDADDPQYQKRRREFARPAVLPELRSEVHYDWAEGRLVRGPALGYDQIFANAAHGFAPGTDEALAGILHRLDTAAVAKTPTLRPLGWWFGHTYCDLEARSYPGITLYDAWYSGDIVDVPDVDAIPFAWQVAGKRRMRSPLSGKPRDDLYAQIRDAALVFRKHRTTLEAAAAAYVRAEPSMDPTYALLVPRFHYLFATRGDDVDEVVATVGLLGRDGLIAEVDGAVTRPDGEAFRVREGRKQELTTMEQRIRALAAATLERFEG